MVRTQISLEPEAIELLDREAARTGASRSELIRRAIRQQYRFTSQAIDPARKRELLDRAFGSWKDRKFANGEEYLRALRSGDWDTIYG
jgi:hypothetical protein